MVEKILAGIAVIIFIAVSVICMFPELLANGGGIREIISDSLNTPLRLFLVYHPFVTVIAGLVFALIAIVLPKPLKGIFLVLYIGFIIYMTLLFRGTGDSRGIFEFFWSYKQALHSSYYRQEILQNMWLFVPLGAVIYSMSGKLWTMMLPIIISAVIELCQYIFGLGLAEIDDIISNTIGAVMGLCIVTILKPSKKRQVDR